MPPEPVTFADAFAAGLLAPQVPAPAIIGDTTGRPAGKRYDVYRNNVTMGLAKSVESIFPAVRHFVGAEAFRGVVIDYVRAEPPASPLLFDYGRGFADWLDKVAPPEFAGWLSDVARLERLWLDAWHAADSDPADIAELAALPPDKLTGVRLVPHPAARLFRSHHPVVSLMRAGRTQAAMPDRSVPEDALVTRPALDVAVRYLPPGAAVFMAALFSGGSLAGAADAGLRDAPGLDIPAAIAAMFDAGAIGAVVLD